mgnify:CR=1 FL=1
MLKDVAKKEVAQVAHEVKGELTYDDKVIQKNYRSLFRESFRLAGC